MENMEMERDYLPPPTKKREIPEFQMDIPSLGEKLQEHMDFRKGPHTLLPDLVAKTAIPLYLFTIHATLYLGMSFVLPLRYKNDDPDIFPHQVLGWFMYAEVMINWFCIRYVDNSYMRYLKKNWEKKRKSPGNPTMNGGDPSMESLLAAEREKRENGLNGAGTQGTGNAQAGNQSPVINSKHPWMPPFRPTQQTTFPYWSWVPCYICQVVRPPRCHHCPLCQTCVLKRDHHCFFAGNCVGWRNQRFFVMFCFWATVGCVYATVHYTLFFISDLWVDMRWFDIFLPVTFFRCVLGYVPWMICFFVLVQTLLVLFIILASGFVIEHFRLINRGKTSFETDNLKKTVELRELRRFNARFRSVFGNYWLLNFIIPMHWLFEPAEDPENWPSVKVYRH